MGTASLRAQETYVLCTAEFCERIVITEHSV